MTLKSYAAHGLLAQKRELFPNRVLSHLGRVVLALALDCAAADNGFGACSLAAWDCISVEFGAIPMQNSCDLVATGMSGNLLKADFERDGPPGENLRVEIERRIRNVSPSFPTYSCYAKTDEHSRGKGSSFLFPLCYWPRLLAMNCSASSIVVYGTSVQLGCVFPLINSDTLFSTSRRRSSTTFLFVEPKR